MGFSVADFGAHPSLADNLVPFSRAMHACWAGGGGTIRVPPGDYRIGGTLAPWRNSASIRFEGEALAGTRLLHTAAGVLFDLSTLARGGGLSRLTLVGGSNTTALLYAAGLNDCWFSDLWLDGELGTRAGAGTIGVYLYGNRAEGTGGCFNNVFERVVIEDCGIGAYLVSLHPSPTTNFNLISKNTFRDCAIRPRVYSAHSGGELPENKLVGVHCINTNCNLFQACDVEQLRYGWIVERACADDAIVDCWNQHACPSGDYRELVIDDSSSIQVRGGQWGNATHYASHPRVQWWGQALAGVHGKVLS